VLEDAHEICAVALPVFEIPSGVIEEILYALPSYALNAAYRHGVFTLVGCAMRTAGARAKAGKFGKRFFKWCA
jgi:hypothetical protein